MKIEYITLSQKRGIFGYWDSNNHIFSPIMNNQYLFILYIFNIFLEQKVNNKQLYLQKNKIGVFHLKIQFI